MKPNIARRGTSCRPSSPPGERHAQREEVDQLRERQRDHREVDALAAYRQRAGQRAYRHRHAHAAQNAQRRVQAPDLDGLGRDIARGAKEHRVAEGQQTAVADQQIERGREQREAEDLDQELRVEHERRDQQQGNGEGQQQALRACGEVFHRASWPNRPLGRIASVMIITMKMTTPAASG
jgi:hypothetical protein